MMKKLLLPAAMLALMITGCSRPTAENGTAKPVEEKAEEITAWKIGSESGAVKPESFTLRLGDLTDDEREIIADGCLINFNREISKDV